ncbi:MAG TPA: DUF2231 domain-containing protein [Anaerolineales bacterium]|nr:DUF2231 domain-containing protein [Anaerolineales bacterium]
MLNQIDAKKLLDEVPYLEEQSKTVAGGLRDLILKGGKPTRRLADLLHGTWLGHPLHPVLTDVTIGAWVLSFAMDLLSLGTKDKELEDSADRLLLIGNAAAIPTALAGMTDFATIPQNSAAVGGAHGLLNMVGFGLNVLNSLSRKSGNRGLGLFLSGMTSSLLMISAYLGGELSYKYKVGTNHIPHSSPPEDWKAVLGEEFLPDGTPKRVEIDNTPILLYRKDGRIFAIGAVCSHAGAPLEDGDFEGHCVTCPWHQSVFDLSDGSVVHGPATYAEPAFEARVKDGNIEVRKQRG